MVFFFRWSKVVQWGGLGWHKTAINMSSETNTLFEEKCTSNVNCESKCKTC